MQKARRQSVGAGKSKRVKRGKGAKTEPGSPASDDEVAERGIELELDLGEEEEAGEE